MDYIGRLLDNRYEILELIGSGGMAQVYKARCNRLNRLVAIKILREDLTDDDEFRRRFHAESQAVAMLSHPNIVGVYDVSHSETMDYIVMELIEGITLKQYMEQKGKLDWREALHFATQIAKALEHAHSRGIIHRDIKPHNIMILKDGSVKVADFGIAQISSVQNTLTREALGSVHYISPEQAKGGHVDERSDLYSLGVVMYEMLAGRPPFDGDTPVSVAIQHINATPAPLRSITPTTPVCLEQITMRAMASDIERRYPNAAAMLSDLEEFRKNPNMTLEQWREQSMKLDASDAEALSEQILRQTAAERAVSKAEGKQKKAKSPKKKTQEQKKTRIAVIIGIVCIALAVGGIGYFLYRTFLSDLFSKTAEDVVPKLVGMYFEDIRESDYPNFKIEIKGWKSSDSYAYGYVMDQSPANGREAKVGTKIELTVSSGVDSSKMPNLVNLSLQNAQASLNALSVGVVVDVVYQPSDVYTDGYVISTSPAYGETLTNGQQVTLLVSQGNNAELVPVPSLVGLQVDEALQRIDEASLARGSILSVESDLPDGSVTFQSVEPEEKVKVGTVINLQVSRGPMFAAEPRILQQSGDVTVSVNEPTELTVQAQTDDAGTLSYVWFETETGSASDGVAVTESRRNPSFLVTPSQPGTYFFFCKVINTVKESTASVNSDVIRLSVEPAAGEQRTKTIRVPMPSNDGVYLIEVFVDGLPALDPFSVEMSNYIGRSVNIDVPGTGVQIVEVYADAQLIYRETIDFSA